MSEQKIQPFGLACFVVFLAVAIWLFNHLMPSTRQNSGIAPGPGKSAAAAPGPSPTTIAPPKLAPPAAKAPIVTPAGAAGATGLPATPATESADPQAELKTLIPEISRLFLAGNSLEIYQNYVAPSEFDPKVVQQIHDEQSKVEAFSAQDPGLREQIRVLRESMARDWEALGTQTPVMNDAGDQATYQLVMNGGNGQTLTNAVVFIKINGKWYMKNPPQE